MQSTTWETLVDWLGHVDTKSIRAYTQLLGHDTRVYMD